MTQVEMILDWLTQGRTITQAEAYEHFGCFRLASRIHDIRCLGHEVEKVMVDGVNRCGENVKYAKYWLKGTRRPQRQHT